MESDGIILERETERQRDRERDNGYQKGRTIAINGRRKASLTMPSNMKK